MTGRLKFVQINKEKQTLNQTINFTIGVINTYTLSLTNDHNLLED
jgi:hypothetical protein